MVIRQGKKLPKKESITPADIIRRDRYGRYNESGHYYATKAGFLRKLPAYRKPAPKPKGYRPQPPIPASTPAPGPARGDDAQPRRDVATGGAVAARTVESGRSGAKISTWFKAAGSMESGKGFNFADSYKAGLMDEDVENYDEGYAMPALFFSSQGHLLGRVKFKGRMPLLDLIEMLNDKLQYLGEESPEFDFRKAYPKWEYKYQIVETIGVTSTVLVEKTDRRP